MPRDSKRPRLGRGLASLIRDSSQPDGLGDYQPTAAAPPAGDATPAAPPGQVLPDERLELVGLAHIRPNPYQPRRTSDEGSLRDLAESLRSHGVLQPVVVADLPEGEGPERYQLIAGERRLRAAQLAGLTEVPCIVRSASPQEMLEMALVENLHREDLNPIERAAGYRDLIDRFGLSQDAVAERVGQPRPSVANYLRVLDLPDSVQARIVAGQLSFGHAKVLAGLAGKAELQQELAKRCVREQLSVRQLERLVRAEGPSGLRGKEGQTPESPPPYFADVERQLSEAVGTKVSIRRGRSRHAGRIVLEYYSLDDFDRIVAALGAKLES